MYEEQEGEGLYTIGTLSRIVGLSADTLRYYDEIGLLKPARTSRQTGYRYYTDAQAATLARILELKQYGFSLNEIKGILSRHDTPPDAVYQLRYQQLSREKEALQQAMDQLAHKLHQNQEGLPMQKRILLADDAAFMRMMLKDILTREGYTVVGEAADGGEAVDLYKSLAPDLVLLNIVMPTMDGLYALQLIKQHDPNACAVICSAMSNARMVTEALLSGARYFVTKPFQANTLTQVIRDALLTETSANFEVLNRVHDACAHDMTDILSQDEIDETIRLAQNSDATIADADALISKIKRAPQPERNAHDESAENTTNIMTMLNRLAHGQEEIKQMLRQQTK